jgi:flagellar basal-body rod modification protein FlgD
MSTSAPTVGTLASAGALGTSGSTVSRTDDTMGENQFLNLMMDQLKAQDPTNPSDPTQFLSELANFSSLEQQTNIAQSQTLGSAFGLIGKTVTAVDANGKAVTGTVSKVNIQNGSPVLTVGDEGGITLSEVQQVSATS